MVLQTNVAFSVFFGKKGKKMGSSYFIALAWVPMFEEIDNIRQTDSATLQFRMAFSFAKMLIKRVLAYIGFYNSDLSHTQKNWSAENEPQWNVT